MAAGGNWLENRGEEEDREGRFNVREEETEGKFNMRQEEREGKFNMRQEERCRWMENGEAKDPWTGEGRERPRKEERRNQGGQRILESSDIPQPGRGAWFLRNFSVRRRLGLIPGIGSVAGGGQDQLASFSSFASSLQKRKTSVRRRGSSPQSFAFPETRRADILAPFAALRRQLAPAALLRLEQSRRNRLDGYTQEEEKMETTEGRDGGEEKELGEGEDDGTGKEEAEGDASPETTGGSGAPQRRSSHGSMSSALGTAYGGSTRRASGEERREEARERRGSEEADMGMPRSFHGTTQRGEEAEVRDEQRARQEHWASAERNGALEETQMKLEEQREAVAIAEAALKLARERIRDLERENASLRARGGPRFLLSLQSNSHTEGINGRREKKQDSDRGCMQPETGAGCAPLTLPLNSHTSGEETEDDRTRRRGEEGEREEGERGEEEREEEEREEGEREEEEREGEREERERDTRRVDKRTYVLEQKLRLYQRQLLFIFQENQRLRDVLIESRKVQEHAKEERRIKQRGSLSEVADVCTYVVSRPQFEL
ncbi:hypothetical protein TGRUB_216370 [Toxoplasma gondii RUB]|uniref:Uncharacterized protein n=1 Tax=Toxoplasma gondii RUB TaxID=935652 RepID=A0A086LP31_TOXGO|nr:hypothetical protein TGRUB_216370 [Toxoplasma gondii RUB]